MMQENAFDNKDNAMKAVASTENVISEKSAASDYLSQSSKPWQTNETQSNNAVQVAPPPTALNPFQNVMTDLSNPDGGSFQSSDNLPKTFKGDRGGNAEDAELLAELRAISSKNPKTGFVEGIADPNQSDQKYSDDSNTSSHQKETVDSAPVSQSNPHIAATPNANDSLAYALPPGSAAPPPEVNVTLENLTDSLKSSNWQLRKGSYFFAYFFYKIVV